MIDHDRLFKELLTVFFADFIALFFPELSAYLDADSITFLDKEVFTDVTEGEQHEADIVARARFRADGSTPSVPTDAFFLIHVENQSYAQSEFPRRMFQYFARLYEKHGLPVYPIAVFSYDAPLRPEPDRFSVAFPDLPVLDFRYRVVQLNRLSWRDFVNTPNPIASALMAKMQIAPEDRWKVKWECLRLLATLRLDRARMRLIGGFVESYLKLSREENAAFMQRMQATHLTEPEQQVLELTNYWIDQGIEQGIEQGVEKGQEQLIVRQLARRCGPLSEETEARVRDLPPARLLDLADALLDFSDRDDLLQFLNTASPQNL